MGGETQGGWGGSTVKRKRTPVLGPGPEYPLVGHRREIWQGAGTGGVPQAPPAYPRSHRQPATNTHSQPHARQERKEADELLLFGKGREWRSVWPGSAGGGLRTCTYRRFWERERSRKGLGDAVGGTSGCGGVAGGRVTRKS